MTSRSRSPSLGDDDPWSGLQLVVGDDMDVYVDGFLRYEEVVELLEELRACVKAGA